MELQFVQDRADVDISGPAFDFVRSIHVYEIDYSQRQNRDGECVRSEAVYLGSYGSQGEYSRWRSRIATVPAASDLKVPADCQGYRHRSLFVEWRDYHGTYGHEEVHY